MTLTPTQRDYGIHWGDDPTDPDYVQAQRRLPQAQPDSWSLVPANVERLIDYLHRQGWSAAQLADVEKNPARYTDEYNRINYAPL